MDFSQPNRTILDHCQYYLPLVTTSGLCRMFFKKPCNMYIDLPFILRLIGLNPNNVWILVRCLMTREAYYSYEESTDYKNVCV